MFSFHSLLLIYSCLTYHFKMEGCFSVAACEFAIIPLWHRQYWTTLNADFQQHKRSLHQKRSLYHFLHPEGLIIKETLGENG
jgi:hypothetical protein